MPAEEVTNVYRVMRQHSLWSASGRLQRTVPRLRRSGPTPACPFAAYDAEATPRKRRMRPIEPRCPASSGPVQGRRGTYGSRSLRRHPTAEVLAERRATGCRVREATEGAARRRP